MTADAVQDSPDLDAVTKAATEADGDADISDLAGELFIDDETDTPPSKPAPDPKTGTEPEPEPKESEPDAAAEAGPEDERAPEPEPEPEKYPWKTGQARRYMRKAQEAEKNIERMQRDIQQREAMMEQKAQMLEQRMAFAAELETMLQSGNARAALEAVAKRSGMSASDVINDYAAHGTEEGGSVAYKRMQQRLDQMEQERQKEREQLDQMRQSQQFESWCHTGVERIMSIVDDPKLSKLWPSLADMEPSTLRGAARTVIEGQLREKGVADLDEAAATLDKFSSRVLSYYQRRRGIQVPGDTGSQSENPSGQGRPALSAKPAQTSQTLTNSHAVESGAAGRELTDAELEALDRKELAAMFADD